MHPLAENLGKAWISDFWSANQQIKWLEVEAERQLWLVPDKVLLVGRIDAIGQTPDGDRFFGEWKSLSASKAKRMSEVKAMWRRSPQALTYGVLMGPETSRFTVRWAIKTPKPTTDFEWYTYDKAEVEHWKEVLLEVANSIRTARSRGEGPWLTNFTSCYRYGYAYACPFVSDCPTASHSEAKPRTPHLDFEREHGAALVDKGVVILDATRTAAFLECPEKYRRLYEGSGTQEENENLVIGGDFHDLVAAHLTTKLKA